MLASSSRTPGRTRPTGPLIPHGAAGAAVPGHHGTGPPASRTHHTKQRPGTAKPPAPVAAADSSRDPQASQPRTFRSGATRLASPAMDLPSRTAGARAGPHGNLTTQRDRNQALIRRCGEDTGARRVAPRLGG